MSDYAKVRTGRLNIKGLKRMGDAATNRKQRKIAKKGIKADLDPDRTSHDGWRAIKDDSELKALPVAFEFAEHRYLACNENGYLNLGSQHDENTGPYQHEIFMLIKAPDARTVALKTCYGFYVSAEVTNLCSSQAEAAGTKEQWTIAFQENGKAIMKSHDGKVLSFDPREDGRIAVDFDTKEEDAIFDLRTNRDKLEEVDDVAPEDLKDDEDCEDSYVTKFQSYQNPRLRKAFGNYEALKDARDRGDLHETMLDRREKAKSDRMCK